VNSAQLALPVKTASQAGQSAQLIATVLLMSYIHNEVWLQALTEKVIQYSLSIQLSYFSKGGREGRNFLLERQYANKPQIHM
jgi:hypothetical protein